MLMLATLSRADIAGGKDQRQKQPSSGSSGGMMVRLLEGWNTLMKSLLVAAALWSLLSFAWLLFYPSGSEALGCMRLIERSSGCDSQQQAINELVWQYQALPTLVAIGSGYVAIVVLRIVRSRQHRFALVDRAAGPN
jgi:hypothetical protein